MKFIRLATVAALSTTILAGGVQAFAEEGTSEVRETTTEGQITFTPGDDETEVDPGTEGPDVEIPPVVGPDGNKGPLTIAYVPTMNFGSQGISTTDKFYDMVAEKHQLKDTVGEENMVPYVSLAQVQDTRGTNEGWDLRVSLSDFVAPSTTENVTLHGARIILHDPRLLYAPGITAQMPLVHENGMELMPNTGAVSIATAAEGQGAGTTTVFWGDHDILAQQIEAGAEVVTNKAIQLFVPGSTAKDAVTYTSTLTWELELTPDNGED